MEISAGLTGDFVGRVTGLTMVISAGSCDTATLTKAIAITRERWKFMVVEVVSPTEIYSTESDTAQFKSSDQMWLQNSSVRNFEQPALPCSCVECWMLSRQGKRKRKKEIKIYFVLLPSTNIGGPVFCPQYGTGRFFFLPCLPAASCKFLRWSRN